MGLQPIFQVSPLILMRTELLASSQSGRSVDADAWCKQTLIASFVGCVVRTLRLPCGRNRSPSPRINRLGYPCPTL